MTSQKSMIVTGHGEFYRASANDEYRYFPLTKRDAAREFDAKADPVIVGGFAVYDTTLSTIFAVGLYATLTEAEAHQATPAPQAPESLFAAPADEQQPTDEAPKRKPFSKGRFGK